MPVQHSSVEPALWQAERSCVDPCQVASSAFFCRTTLCGKLSVLISMLRGMHSSWTTLASSFLCIHAKGKTAFFCRTTLCGKLSVLKIHAKWQAQHSSVGHALWQAERSYIHAKWQAQHSSVNPLFGKHVLVASSAFLCRSMRSYVKLASSAFFCGTPALWQAERSYVDPC
ncbi:unnamed protein product [Acanthosepion pharaonis]|uniref:Uncharacterized protein n=1 Tax=Acanthosepion pharaonis TaxID=158019 RepID=A0A812DMR7_ACAPH|nr:unnamed protein product [Sepia pharaonis]